MNNEIKGKKLLILGANPETKPLVETANAMGVITLVTSNIDDDLAKSIAWKAYNIDGNDVAGVISIIHKEKVDGVLVGVADSLVPAYSHICNALNIPCYVNEDIIKIFSYKDVFKATFERFGIHGIPEYFLDHDIKEEDINSIIFPVMVKPVDSHSGLGMSICYNKQELKQATKKALDNSDVKRFIVERYMECDDVGIYYTFQNGKCSLSAIFDRYTCSEQPGVSKVSLGGIYPSKHIDDYYERMHGDAIRLFKKIGVKDGVLLIQAFYENGEFYVYDMGFRLQGEAPHLLIKSINGFDQREMLIRYALGTPDVGLDIEKLDDPNFKGKSAATLWFLLRAGTIGKIEGIDAIDCDNRIVDNVQRFREGDTVIEEWVGTEKQVFTRLYIVCSNKDELKACINEYRKIIKVYDTNGKNMLITGFDVNMI